MGKKKVGQLCPYYHVIAIIVKWMWHQIYWLWIDGKCFACIVDLIQINDKESYVKCVGSVTQVIPT
jgi:hypothetical protein